MTDLRLEPVPGTDSAFRAALIEAHLPTADIEDSGRAFYRAGAESGATVGYCGIETCGMASLFRSLVILPEHHNRGFGRILTRLTLAQAMTGSDIYLVTTTAALFFQGLGFAIVDRSCVPETVLATRQLSGLCPASAVVMKCVRPPA